VRKGVGVGGASKNMNSWIAMVLTLHTGVWNISDSF
jgi:hypothetical protein